MIRHFATYEEAGIYADWMRSEGHFSAILDERVLAIRSLPPGPGDPPCDRAVVSHDRRAWLRNLE
jgi:hypothetical protein